MKYNSYLRTFEKTFALKKADKSGKAGDFYSGVIRWGNMRFFISFASEDVPVKKQDGEIKYQARLVHVARLKDVPFGYRR